MRVPCLSQTPLAAALKAARLRMGLSQTGLARRLDSAQGVISQIESGKRALTVDEVLGWLEVTKAGPLETFLREFL